MTGASDTPERLVVAIDGPSGSGKSSVARALAQRLGYQYLDTGAMYRAVTWFLLREGIAIDADNADLPAALDRIALRFAPEAKVFLGDADVTEHIRSKEVESRVSAVAAIPEVRSRMRVLQQALAENGPVVAEGRDMASVVFPDAAFKFYIDADPAERARRRAADFRARGRSVTDQEVLEELAVRDRLDSTRKDAPLRRTDAATLVDTTWMTLAEVVEHLAQLVAGAAE